MQIKIAGVDYLNAPLHVREKFAFTSVSAVEFLTKIKHSTKECVLLSTCNRTELITISDTDPSELLRKERGDADFFTYEGEEAVKHIYNVASGICSQVPLEDQILGQVKDSLSLARSVKCSGPVLDKLFLSAVSAGKEVRTEVKKKGNDSTSSVAMLALEKAKDFFGELKNKKCLIIGSGATGMLCAELFSEAGAEVTMTIRRHRNDEALPSKNVKTVNYADKSSCAAEADLIIGATASPHFVLTENDYKEGNKKVLILDLAVPRDIVQKIGEYKNVTLFDMDTLGCPAVKPEFMEKVQEIITQHRNKFHEWGEIKECMSMIDEICSYAEREIVSNLECNNEITVELIEDAARTMMSKLLFSMKDTVGIKQAKDCYKALAKVVR